MQDVMCFLEVPRALKKIPIISYHLKLVFTTLQVEISRVRFPIVLLEFFIDIILPALGSTQWIPGIFPGR